MAFSPNYVTDKKFYTFTTETYNSSNTATFVHPEQISGPFTPSNEQLVREWTEKHSRFVPNWEI